MEVGGDGNSGSGGDSDVEQGLSTNDDEDTGADDGDSTSSEWLAPPPPLTPPPSKRRVDGKGCASRCQRAATCAKRCAFDWIIIFALFGVALTVACAHQGKDLTDLRGPLDAATTLIQPLTAAFTGVHTPIQATTVPSGVSEKNPKSSKDPPHSVPIQ